MCLQYKFFENNAGKGEIACDKQFLLFPQCFLSFLRTFCLFHQIRKCPLQTLSARRCLKFIVWERVKAHFTWLNSFPNKPGFLRVCSKRLLKTMKEKKKLLVMSNFSFSHIVFYPFGELSVIFINFENVVCNSFSLEESKICRLGKG